MDWLKQRVIEALTGAKPISRKLLLLIAAAVAGTVLLINMLAPQSNANATGEITVGQAKVAETANSENLSLQNPSTFVHVVGEVLKPGIYELDSGSRIVDAIFAAGGFLEDADQSSINLAREISDGEQVIVLKIGQAPQIGASAVGGSALIGINRASAEELEKLPGVGPALAGRILDWRSANGGFKKKEDLLSISGIGDKLFAAIKDQITL